ncbi:MAG: SURF1 family protein [Rubrivivax sp.]|nr:SURF1 family protein [Rubrivivax sp.]MDP3082380.1 SURF1 family protein [Rubrivivax sp.]
MPLNGRAFVVLLAAVAGVVLTARLGVWQLDRAAQKTALQQALDQRRELPALTAAELTRDAATAPAQHYRRVVVDGHWLAERTLYLDNRQMNGRVGFYVVTPLRLADDSVVLVQRGWQPRDQLDRSRVNAPPTPVGLVRLVGRVGPAPARLYEFDAAASGVIRQNIELTAYAHETALPLRPLTIVQEDAAAGTDDGLLRQWPRPAAGVDKNHGYAFQWFALATLILGLYVWFQLLRPRRR